MPTEHLPALEPSQVLVFVNAIGLDGMFWDNPQQHVLVEQYNNLLGRSAENSPLYLYY